MAWQNIVLPKESSLCSYGETSGQPVYSFPSYSIMLDEIYWWGKHESSRSKGEPGRRESNKQANKDGDSRCLVFSVLAPFRSQLIVWSCLLCWWIFVLSQSLWHWQGKENIRSVKKRLDMTPNWCSYKGTVSQWFAVK